MRKEKKFSIRVFLHDEFPRLGCGMRFLTVHKGRKYIRLRDHMGRCVRIPITMIERTYPWLADQL